LKTYSDEICDWLIELGYTHCFFVAGGNIMHLLNSARTSFVCVPVVHEVSAGIAAEYFNEVNSDSDSKAFVLVTAGPGLTNTLTAIAGAFMESRSLLVIGGQVKSPDLSLGHVRQRGIQEIDGVALARSISKVALALRNPIPKSEFVDLVSQADLGRKGPVFLEICLDVQGQPGGAKESGISFDGNTNFNIEIPEDQIHEISRLLVDAKRPIILIGGGISRSDFGSLYGSLLELGVPLMSTWNGADRIPNDSPIYWGRPNTWGMRYSNILIQQSDLVIALGTRLGLQHTGFNWQGFAPLAKVVQVDIDKAELEKGHPVLHKGINGDAKEFLTRIIRETNFSEISINPWIEFGNKVKKGVPLSDRTNNSFEGYWNPYDFMKMLSQQLKKGDVMVPSSSGAAETVAMQAAEIPSGAFVITDKGMASMGYGLAGAIGAAFKTNSRVIHVEGDGGFAQNLQELGTVRINNLPIKTFIFENGGYASIRMTQKSYFDGQIIGCGRDSGLGLPNWVELFNAFGITCEVIDPARTFSPRIQEQLNDNEPRAYLIPIHPDQTYFPKITSRMREDGGMESNPLHLMTPDLSEDEVREYLPYLASRILQNKTT
jgi:acetolactate synthase-1/2/3 large subunit